MLIIADIFSGNSRSTRKYTTSGTEITGLPEIVIPGVCGGRGTNVEKDTCPNRAPALTSGVRIYNTIVHLIILVLQRIISQPGTNLAHVIGPCL